MQRRRKRWVALGVMVSLVCGCGEIEQSEVLAEQEAEAPAELDLNDRVIEDKSDRGSPFVQMRGQLAVRQSLYDFERRNVVVLDVFWYTDR